ncbi:MAG: peptidoglycan D,D-transpeptidase FtsI family protein [Solirubrobacteraceae bacterium]
MNRSIVRLFGVMVLLFALLIVWTSRWTVFSATSLDNNPLNQLQFYASLKIRRGDIYADNGTVLATSRRGAGGVWKRVYPQGSLFAQTVGFYFPQGVGSAGLEQTASSYLEGQQNSVSSVFGNLNGTSRTGDSVYTTLDPTAQALARQEIDHAMSAYGATAGSVVAIVPQTGAVKVLYSTPSYNDNNPNARGSGRSQFFDAVQGTYPPGSTFKLVISTAALNTGKFTPLSELAGPSPLLVSGTPLHNDGDQSWPATTTLTTALTYSINTIYAQVGERLGAATVQAYMQRYGFYSMPPLDLPAGQMQESGEFYKGRFVPVTNPNIDLGRTSIGQADLAVTPLQMAMVVAGIANDGTLMTPHLVAKVVNPDGQLVSQPSPTVYHQVMKPKYAAELAVMMEHVVEEGTGQAAQLYGLKVAGKTGTATTGGTRGGQPLDDAWFVGFPVNDPRIAVAVELSNIQNGYGGTYAAPIAAQVIKTLLAEHQ